MADRPNQPNADSSTHPPTVDNPARTPETHVGDAAAAANTGDTARRPVPVVPGTPGVPDQPVAPKPAPTTATAPAPAPAPKK